MMSPDKYIDVGHSKIAYWRTGSGPDVLFIHGWPLHGATFRNIIPHMSGYTCHVIDLPGTGQTETSAATPYGLRAHADTVVSVVEALGLQKVSFVAHDSGGGVARFAAARLQDRVKALVLSGTEIPGHHSWLLKMYVLGNKVSKSGALLKVILGSRTLRNSFLAFGGCFDDVSHVDGEFASLFLKPLRDDRVLGGQLQLLRHLSFSEVDELKEAHAQITAPTLLFWGEDDPFFPMPLAKKMAPQFAGPTEFEVVDDAKLFVHEEYPERFAESAQRFLDKHLAKRAAGERPSQTSSHAH